MPEEFNDCEFGVSEGKTMIALLAREPKERRYPVTEQ
jgi:hypothetical protein